MPSQKQYTFDKNLQLKDAGLVAASAAAQVASADKILDLGAGRVDGTVIVDWTACEVASGDESYHIELQFSSSATFATGNVLGPCIKLGDSSVSFATVDTAASGRREIPFTNEIEGTIYRYMRLYTRIAGAIATGLNYAAFAAKN